MKLRVGWLSVVGKRDNNEDACYVDPRNRFFLVADGMGGQSAGERASGLAMELVPRKLQLIDFEKSTPEAAIKIIDEAITQANYEIMALGELDPKLKNMGTTITFIVHVAGTMFVGGVGDSRVYLLRGDKLQQLTTDHSLTQALIEAGTLTPEEAVNHRYKNVLYRYLGCKEGGAGTNPKQVRPQAGDRFLICSDGVTGGADDSTLCEVLARGTDPQKTAEAVVQAATDGGSKDNITGVVLFVDQV
ncbi:MULTISPECIES: PP2C family serine/threonine-protein phosphatase [unclassified Schlesneria]|uniref:PP2C family protein-serine/threonine phosphatase n=1 Tax=Schlesneria TaxID=656899 RepID=UPI0035A12679